MTAFAHSYDFDPSYGYTKDDLLAIRSPAAPSDFAWFWQERYQHAMTLHPHPRIRHTGDSHEGYEIYSLRYFSTNSFVIRGWVLSPAFVAYRAARNMAFQPTLLITCYMIWINPIAIFWAAA